MTTNKFDGKSDQSLKELKAQLDASSASSTQQAGTFWGQGFTAGSDIYLKNAEEFGKLSEEIGQELKAREESRLTPEQKKANAAAQKENEEQGVSTFPPDIKPADQPTPATQPYEPSTEAQGTANKKQ